MRVSGVGIDSGDLIDDLIDSRIGQEQILLPVRNLICGRIAIVNSWKAVGRIVHLNRKRAKLRPRIVMPKDQQKTCRALGGFDGACRGVAIQVAVCGNPACVVRRDRDEAAAHARRSTSVVFADRQRNF